MLRCRSSGCCQRPSCLDLLLLQWPLPQVAPIAAQWAAMEALVDAGLVRDIGVCNFSSVKLEALMAGQGGY